MLESLPIIYIFWHYLLSTRKREYFRNVTESLLLSSLVSIARFSWSTLKGESRRPRRKERRARAISRSILEFFCTLLTTSISYSFTLLFCLRPFEYSASACVRYKYDKGRKAFVLRFLPRYFRFDTKFSRENILCDTMWQLSKIIQL